MPITDKFFAVNIRKYLALGNDREAGEPALAEMLSGFSCSKNPDVERFLKKSAIEFTKKNQSITYLVFSKDNGELLGYFTITLKPLICLVAWLHFWKRKIRTSCYPFTRTIVFHSLIPDRSDPVRMNHMSSYSF